MWEHTWTRLKSNIPALQATIQSYNLKPPLHPRDAFFGGRTNAVRLYVENEQLHYYDFTSLVPMGQQVRYVSCGSSHLHLQPTQSSRHLSLLWHCQVHRLTAFWPLSSRLALPLWPETCIHKSLHEKPWVCDHTPQQRQLSGTWCTPEIEKALEQGYTLVCLHEVWHFEQQQTGLFRDYVNTWLKIKDEASGWPGDCTTPEKRQQHLQAYFEHKGVQLDENNIRVNKGRRAVAKLMLNSMWGNSIKKKLYIVHSFNFGVINSTKLKIQIIWNSKQTQCWFVIISVVKLFTSGN